MIVTVGSNLFLRSTFQLIDKISCVLESPRQIMSILKKSAQNAEDPRFMHALNKVDYLKHYNVYNTQTDDYDKVIYEVVQRQKHFGFFGKLLVATIYVETLNGG